VAVGGSEQRYSNSWVRPRPASHAPRLLRPSSQTPSARGIFSDGALQLLQASPVASNGEMSIKNLLEALAQFPGALQTLDPQVTKNSGVLTWLNPRPVYRGD
jgi:hypothetical protein